MGENNRYGCAICWVYYRQFLFSRYVGPAFTAQKSPSTSRLDSLLLVGFWPPISLPTKKTTLEQFVNGFKPDGAWEPIYTSMGLLSLTQLKVLTVLWVTPLPWPMPFYLP